jgi:ApaG protein
LAKSHTTKGIVISVETNFDGDMKDTVNVKFIFSYTITLQNTLMIDVQLISRKWEIFDSIGTKHTVEGEGVIGLQPIIKPGEVFTYSSWCPLDSSMGRMKGHYNMVNLESNEMFQIEIPQFELFADWIKN